MLSPARARRLKPLLDGLLDPAAMAARVAVDPVRFPRAFGRPADAEVAGLLASSLAYGRADLFGAVLDAVFRRLGPRPAEVAQAFSPTRDAKLFAGLRYRFNVPADLATLFAAAGRVQREQGSLGAAFAGDLQRAGDLRGALEAFTARLRAPPPAGLERALGPLRGFGHLVPEPARGGACKRLLLYLRWMVRGGPSDPIDLGLWSGVPPAALLVPLDTHVARLSLALGLTRRTDLSWRTAEDVTASLRRLDPLDPVKYDFALCHQGMSGACPRRRSPASCGACRLAPACRLPVR